MGNGITLADMLAENTKFICQLPNVTQAIIMAGLLNKGIDGANLTEALSERACNIVEVLRY